MAKVPLGILKCSQVWLSLSRKFSLGPLAGLGTHPLCLCCSLGHISRSHTYHLAVLFTCQSRLPTPTWEHLGVGARGMHHCPLASVPLKVGHQYTALKRGMLGASLSHLPISMPHPAGVPKI